MKYKSLWVALIAGILCCPFLSFGTYTDLMNFGIEPTAEEKQKKLAEAERLKELEKINLFEMADSVAADDLLFAPKTADEAEGDVSRNRLYSYYKKRLGVDSLAPELFDSFIKEDFGDVSYDEALASIKETKTWGTTTRDPTPQELEQYRMTIWEQLAPGGAFVFVGLLASIAAIAIFHKTADFNVKKSESKPEEKEIKMLGQCPTPKRTLGFFKNMNNGQKIALLIPVGLCCLILSLHNPFGGYETGYGRSFFEFKSRNCPLKAIDEIGEAAGMMIPLLAFGGFVVLFLRSNKNKPQQ